MSVGNPGDGRGDDETSDIVSRSTAAEPDAMGRSGADAGLRGDRDAGNSRVEDEAGKEDQGVENLVVTEDGGHRVRAASAVDQGTE